MGVSKVIFNNRTLIDLTSDTVTPGTLLKGYTATNAAGEKITGTYEDSSMTVDDIFPVGAIYIMTTNTNPSTIFSGTTWVAVDIYIYGSSDQTTYAFKRTA